MIEALKAQGIERKQAMFVLGQVLFEQGYAPRSAGAKKMWAANAFFNIKGKGSAGSVTITTTEYYNGKKTTIQDGFRAYNNFDDAVADYLSLIKRLYPKSYASLTNPNSKVSDFSYGLMHGKKGAYATDPNYQSLMETYVNTVNKGMTKHGGGNANINANAIASEPSPVEKAPQQEIVGSETLDEVVITAKGNGTGGYMEGAKLGVRIDDTPPQAQPIPGKP